MAVKKSSELALILVRVLQKKFVSGLEARTQDRSNPKKFDYIEWQRNGGENGGGSRYFICESEMLNRASVNVSHIHYHNDPQKKLASATALSTIIHPQNPHMPSVHMHISWTEMKGHTNGYWRVMADLNPAIKKTEDVASFQNTLRDLAPDLFGAATEQGDKYFYIPALGKHRGATHFYLEQYQSGNTEDDLGLSSGFGNAVIDYYLELLSKRIKAEVSTADREQQLAYHTLYLFQVLTLDRGTTSGLLVHDENDLGIMGSLPSRVDKNLLRSWIKKTNDVQLNLLDDIISAIPESGEITNDVRLALAKTVRDFYKKYPDALRYQASGNVVPPTVENHR